jgi:hypothetical protein
MSACTGGTGVHLDRNERGAAANEAGSSAFQAIPSFQPAPLLSWSFVEEGHSQKGTVAESKNTGKPWGSAAHSGVDPIWHGRDSGLVTP